MSNEMTVSEELAELKRRRAALDDHINAIEAGISKASYDGSLREQLAGVNSRRAQQGLEPLNMTQWMVEQDVEDERA